MIHIIKNDSFIYKSQEHTNVQKINFGCSITVDSHVTKVHLLQTFLDPQKHALIDNDVETFLGSHSREKGVNLRRMSVKSR
jgi:hypothetical protein